MSPTLWLVGGEPPKIRRTTNTLTCVYASWRKQPSTSSKILAWFPQDFRSNAYKYDRRIDDRSTKWSIYKNRGGLFALVGHYSVTKDIKVFSVSQFGFSFGQLSSLCSSGRERKSWESFLSCTVISSQRRFLGKLSIIHFKWYITIGNSIGKFRRKTNFQRRSNSSTKWNT